MNTEQIKADPQTEEGCASLKIEVLKKLIEMDYFHSENLLYPQIHLFDLDRLKSTIQSLLSAFPSDWLHCAALKSNMIHKCLLIMKESGMGFEAASFGELEAAFRTQIDPSKIVFDSPVKTIIEIKKSLEKGIYLNVDNFQELERVATLIQTGNYPKAKVGLRINPQTGLGTIKEMSVSGDHSKFGIGLIEFQEKILKAYATYSWLVGIHLHSGSQGIPLNNMILGVTRLLELVQKIDTHRSSQQILFIDIGGGLPVNFDSESDTSDPLCPSFGEYRKMLEESCPYLFSGKVKVITEFGRRISAKAGFYISRVEYTKRAGNRNIAAIHGGTDFFMRTVFMPTKWAIRVSVCDASGHLKKGNLEKQDIAGPCCFAADVIAHERELPLIDQGDFVIAHDVGAYYFSSYCYYNSRQAPSVYFVQRNEDKSLSLEVIKAEQQVEHTLSMYI